MLKNQVKTLTYVNAKDLLSPDDLAILSEFAPWSFGDTDYTLVSADRFRVFCLNHDLDCKPINAGFVNLEN